MDLPTLVADIGIAVTISPAPHCYLPKQHGTRLCSLHRQIDEAVARLEATFAKVSVADLLKEDNPIHPLCDTSERPAKFRISARR